MTAAGRPVRDPATQPWPGVALRILLGGGVIAGIAWWGDVRAGLPLAIAAGIASAALWALPATPGDTVHPRGILRVPGRLRLTLDVALILLAATAIWTAGSRAASETLLTTALIHAALTHDRIRWLARAAAKPGHLG